MPRGLTASLETATLAATVAPIMLIEALFDSGATRLWTGLGDLAWNSQTWTGAGSLLGIADVQETAEIRATGVDVTLTGVPSTLVSLALSEPYQGRVCNIWLGALDTATLALIADPYLLFAGRMDVMTLEEGAETATITLSVESRLIDLDVSRERRYEHQDQLVDASTDRFLEYTTTLIDAQIVWGRA
jgi:hypothetical protein